MEVFKTIEQSLFSLIKDKIKLNSLRKDQVREIISMEKDMLKSLSVALGSYDKTSMEFLTRKYYAAAKPATKDSIDYIIPGMRRKLNAKARSLEEAKTFGAAEKAVNTYMTILSDIEKNLDTLFEKEEITLYESKLSNLMILGMLREADIVVNYTSYLYTYFSDTIANKKDTIIGYRRKYLIENYEKYLNILDFVCNKEGNYRYLQDIDSVKRKNADLILYANNNSFFNVLNIRAFDLNHMFHLKYGVFGFNFFTFILSLFNDWRHTQYQKKKDLKEWLEVHNARLKQELRDTDPNSPEYARLTKVINAYDMKITDLDKKIRDYEEGK